MEFLERDLENILYEELQTEKGYEALHERGLNICYSPDSFTCKRQLKIGNYGICDLITFSRFLPCNEGGMHNNSSVFIEIIELKKGAIGIDALIQASRYLKGVKKYMQTNYSSIKPNYSITLIGRSINLDDWVYLTDLVPSLNIQTYSYGIDGIKFKVWENFSLVNEGLDRFDSLAPF